jgi:hypothetical protein
LEHKISGAIFSSYSDHLKKLVESMPRRLLEVIERVVDASKH